MSANSAYAVPQTRAELAAYIDHTLLKPEATRAQFHRSLAEGEALGVKAVCVSPSALPLRSDKLLIATVCGFPSGAVKTEIKAAEAARSVVDGANEVDMVIDIGRAKSADFDAVASDIAAVVDAVDTAAERAGTSALVKVIIESAALTQGEIVAVCQHAVGAGAEFVKTSTGFHPAGGATVEAVKLMRETVGPHIGVKASGGIRSLAQAQAMIAAGASRLGLSASSAILAEFDSGL